MQLVWHRGDLRTHDHPALAAAAHSGEPVLGLVILDPVSFAAASPRRQALFVEHVQALRERYRALGSELLVRQGEPRAVLEQLRLEQPFTRLHALRSYSPYGVERDRAVTHALESSLAWHEGLYVRAPGELRSGAGTPYSIYGAYARAWRAAHEPEPLDAPQSLLAPERVVEPGELPRITSDVPLPTAGEDAALAALREFIEQRLPHYAEQRDRLDGSGSSRLSIYITVGALSARTAAAALWHRRGEGAGKWLSELGWRDFLAELLYQRPELRTQPYQERWSRFPWRDAEADFLAWRDGQTGIPAVDAAMRELRQTGWISNRARMLAAQFLTKQLRIDWRRGERVFRDWLLDGDAASNIGNWQWAAGLGVDNAPYFRVFNPVTQAKAHDPDGSWLRRWVPESGGDARALPQAIVDLARARREYLAEAEAVR